MVEWALASTHATEVETQSGEAAALKCLIKRLGNAVVHGAAALGMGVQNHGDWCAGTRSGAEAAFKTAFRAGKNNCGHRHILVKCGRDRKSVVEGESCAVRL